MDPANTLNQGPELVAIGNDLLDAAESADLVKILDLGRNGGLFLTAASMAKLLLGRPKVRWASVLGKTTPSRRATTGYVGRAGVLEPVVKENAIEIALALYHFE